MENLDAVLATVVELLKVGGHLDAIEVLRESEPDLEQSGYDNWNGGTTQWTLRLPVEPARYSQLGDRRSSMEDLITAAFKEVVGEMPNDWYAAKIVPRLVSNPDWRRSTSIPVRASAGSLGRAEVPMFNLLISGVSHFWELGEADFEFDRFLEHTDDGIKERFKPLTDEHVEALKKLPSLFAYEAQCKAAARAGRLIEVRRRRGRLHLKFEFDDSIAPIPPERVRELATALDFSGWEENRTHWAIKDVDLYKVLAQAGFEGALATRQRQAEIQRIASGMPAFDASKPKAKVFVVHGRDTAAKSETARFLERIGVEALILHEQPNAGRTLIVKFQEVAAGADFAVVLITPDDVGGLSGGQKLQARARQNVIFELGFFVGKLGPKKVCALVSDGVEKPSDFDGVVYVPLDAVGAWKIELARELRAAGIAFDPSKVF